MTSAMVLSQRVVKEDQCQERETEGGNSLSRERERERLRGSANFLLCFCPPGDSVTNTHIWPFIFNIFFLLGYSVLIYY